MWRVGRLDRPDYEKLWRNCEERYNTVSKDLEKLEEGFQHLERRFEEVKSCQLKLEASHVKLEASLVKLEARYAKLQEKLLEMEPIKRTTYALHRRNILDFAMWGFVGCTKSQRNWWEEWKGCSGYKMWVQNLKQLDMNKSVLSDVPGHHIFPTTRVVTVPVSIMVAMTGAVDEKGGISVTIIHVSFIRDFARSVKYMTDEDETVMYKMSKSMYERLFECLFEYTVEACLTSPDPSGINF